MSNTLKYNPEESYLLHSMYNELFLLNIDNNDYKTAKIHFQKVLKYFDIFCSFFKYNNQAKDIVQELEQNLGTISKIASSHFDTKNLKKDNSNLDEFEKLFKKNNKEYAYKQIAENLHTRGANKSATFFLEKAIALKPQDYHNYKILGKCYIELNKYQEAVTAFEKFNQFCQTDAETYVILGFLYQNFGKYENFETRINVLEKAIDLDPDNIDGLRCLAVTYKLFGNTESSIKYYERLLKLEPINEDYASYAYLKIKQGDFEEGLKYIDYRFKKENSPVYYPKINKPKWDGKISLDGKTLLVRFEQGFGDSIQFFRYLSKIKAKKIIFQVQDELFNLFQKNAGDIKIIKQSTSLDEINFDYHIPLLSLLKIFEARINNIPTPEGYIKSDSDKTQFYKEKSFNNNKYKIGIAWQGLKSGNNYRNVDLKAFELLTKLENVQVYSLQKGADEELQTSINQGVNIIDLGQTFNDFSDTASAIENLNLVISSDNVILNLAGAMGKKSFLLLNYDSSWRWFDNKDKTPWYDSVRIFKQDALKEPWEVVIEKTLRETLLTIKDTEKSKT